MAVDGTPFGRYRLIELLGRGGMGEVWRAYDPSIDRVVALKVLPPTFADDQVFQERFRREARSAAGLDEPHVVPIHEFGEIEGRLYVTMRLIKGRDLQELLEDGPLPPARAVKIIEQIASALHAAHGIGLVHRDVKPSNILVAQDDFAYLIDFGIARAEGETGLTSTGATIGTWAYMAPERFRNGKADARADTYALACVLYQSLTGDLPFPANSLEQIAVAHMMEPPPKPSQLRPQVPAAMDDVIATGMAKDPDNRYATTVALADAARDAISLPIPRPAQNLYRLPPFVANPAPPTPVREPAAQQHPADLNLAATQQRPPGWPAVIHPRPAERPGAWAGEQTPPQQPGGPPPKQPASRGDRNQWLALGVAALVVVAALGGAGIYYFGIKKSNNTAATTAATTTPTPTGNTTTPTPTATTTTSPSAAADVPGLAPFVGNWRGHARTLVIRQSGSGHLAYSDLTACPSCALANAPTGTVDFTLTSVSNDVATGSVDASSDEQNVVVGAPVTIQLVAGSPSGQILQMSTGRMQQLPFCNNTSTGQCGA
jgi:serine/threonine protein kinase